jgi:hypothetical protein
MACSRAWNWPAAGLQRAGPPSGGAEHHARPGDRRRPLDECGDRGGHPRRAPPGRLSDRIADARRVVS